MPKKFKERLSDECGVKYKNNEIITEENLIINKTINFYPITIKEYKFVKNKIERIQNISNYLEITNKLIKK